MNPSTLLVFLHEEEGYYKVQTQLVSAQGVRFKPNIGVEKFHKIISVHQIGK